MCLIVLAWHAHPEYPLIVAANRDEHFDRPTAAAHWWPDAPDLLAGRDLTAQGTWLGIARNGRFAALTNYRDPRLRREGAPSRGGLVRDSLVATAPTLQTLSAVAATSDRYAAFNLLVSDGMSLGIHESATGATRLLAPGVHALSNHLLDTPWPKLRTARERFTRAIETPENPAPFLDLLRDDQPAADADLPSTGVGLDWERRLSPVFVRAPGYGTRSSSLLAVRKDGEACFTEWTWNEDAGPAGEAHYQFRIEAD